ncbi:MAG: hypothetical protein JOZ08_05970 [Verrucomicrobia bacterium]|nr:hypothetical protein [Verrucomicrobiota bacterium]
MCGRLAAEKATLTDYWLPLTAYCLLLTPAASAQQLTSVSPAKCYLTRADYVVLFG